MYSCYRLSNDKKIFYKAKFISKDNISEEMMKE